MASLDIKDRKILYELDLNSRQSLTQIGKKVGLKKELVKYRLKKLQDDGIIKNFWTAINTFKLGYSVFRVYISFQYINQEVKNEIINKFVEYKNTWTVKSHRGEIDLAIIIWVKNIFDFYYFWEIILDQYEDYFAKSVVSIYARAVCYKKSYLIPEREDIYDRIMYIATSGEKAVKIDETDYNLLNELAVNARIPLIELAEKLDCSSHAISYRIKNLMKNRIINAFRVNVDLFKLGLQHYKVDIYLKQHRYKKSIIKYLENKPYFEGLNLAIGWADIEPEFIVENVDELTKILSNISSSFPNIIKKQNFWITEKNYKERWLPEIY